MPIPRQCQSIGSEILVTSLVVSFNRLATLRQVMDSLVGQTRRPDRILVVDNGSTDGSIRYLRSLASTYAELSVIESTTNRGGAGGFALGTDAALADTTDFLWLMDDDAVPRPDCLERLLSALTDSPDIPFVSPTVTDADGVLHTRNRPFLSPLVPESLAAAEEGHLAVSAVSFVGPLIRASAARRTHLPLDDFFLWHDDTEYTARLAADIPGRQVPQARITHLVSNAGPGQFVPPRAVVNIRNLVWCVRESRTGSSALTPSRWAGLLRDIVIGQIRHTPRRRWPRVLASVVRGVARGVVARPRHRPPGDILAAGGFIRH